MHVIRNHDNTRMTIVCVQTTWARVKNPDLEKEISHNLLNFLES